MFGSKGNRQVLYYKATLPNGVEHELSIAALGRQVTELDAEVMAHYIRSWWGQMLALGEELPSPDMPHSVEDLLKGLTEDEC